MEFRLPEGMLFVISTAAAAHNEDDVQQEVYDVR